MHLAHLRRIPVRAVGYSAYNMLIDLVLLTGAVACFMGLCVAALPH